MLWPFALKAAQDRINQLNVNLEGTTPDMRFSGVTAASLRLRDFHTFGCPCYILDSRLQTDSKGVPKWEPRARLGIYVGRSPNHASNVALVLNPKTGLVSPQFHVVFDDDFTTVPHLLKGTVPPNWAKLVANSSERSTEQFYDLTKTWFEQIPDKTAGEEIDPAIPENEGADDFSISSNDSTAKTSNVSEGDTSTIPDSNGATLDSEGDTSASNNTMPKMIDLETAGHRRSP